MEGVSAGGGVGEVIVLVSDGPHSPEKWSAVTAKQIADLIQIDGASATAEAARHSKSEFQARLSECLVPFFDDVMADERDGIELGIVKKRNDPFSIGHIDECVASVISAAHEFSEHFSSSDVKAVISRIVAQNFIDAANVQRLWTFDEKGL